MSSMLTYETSSKLGTLLLAIAKGEQEIEVIRQNLCKLREFEPYAAFQRIQKSNTGFINASDVRAFLAENRIFYTENQCYIFIKTFDCDKDSQLSYAEFLKTILSINNAQLRASATQRMNYKVPAGQMLPINVERVLAKLVDAELSFYLNHDLQKARLTQQKDFTYSIAFSTMDKYLSEFLDYDNITSFLKGQAMYPDKEDVIAILQRMSNNDKGLVTYDEFSSEIEPLTDLARESTSTIALKEKRSFHQKSSSVSFSLVKPNQNTLVSAESSPGVYDPSKYDAQNMLLVNRSEKSEQEFSFTGPAHYNVSKSAQKSDGLSLSTAAFSSDKEVNKQLLFTSQKERVKEYPNREDELNINFTRILRQLLAFTKQVEIAREKLAQQTDFCISAFFGTFNPENRVFVSETQLEEGLKRYGVFARKEELRLLFKRLDKDGDGALRAPDFEDMLLPREYELASLVRTRSAFWRTEDRNKTVDQLFSSETKRALNKVLTLCLENEGLGQSLKEGLNKKTTFNVREVFEQLDADQDGYITPKEMREVLEKNDWYVTEDELKLLVGMFDSNKDDRISFVEFSQELSICKV